MLGLRRPVVFTIYFVLALFFLSIASGYTSTLNTVAAASPQQIACKGSGGTWTDDTCKENTANGPAVKATIKRVVNILLFLTGIIAVIVIIIAGLRFVTANGEPQQVSKAKTSIIYAVIGIIVAFMAYAIVNFILDQVA